MSATHKPTRCAFTPTGRPAIRKLNSIAPRDLAERWTAWHEGRGAELDPAENEPLLAWVRARMSADRIGPQCVEAKTSSYSSVESVRSFFAAEMRDALDVLRGDPRGGPRGLAAMLALCDQAGWPPS